MSKETAFYETPEFRKTADEWNKSHPNLKVGGKAGKIKSSISQLRENGFDNPVSAEDYGLTQLLNQKLHDEAIIHENTYSASTPLNKSGLPPCKQREEQVARGDADFEIQ